MSGMKSTGEQGMMKTKGKYLQYKLALTREEKIILKSYQNGKLQAHLLHL